MLIEINDSYRITSDRRNWIIEKPRGKIWERKLFYSSSIGLYAEIKKLAPQHLGQLEPVFAAIERMAEKIKTCVIHLKDNRHSFFWFDYSSLRPEPKTIELFEVPGITKLFADKYQFKAGYQSADNSEEGDVKSADAEQTSGQWKHEHFHRTLDEALTTSFLRTCRANPAASRAAILEEIQNLGDKFIAAATAWGRHRFQTAVPEPTEGL